MDREGFSEIRVAHERRTKCCTGPGPHDWFRTPSVLEHLHDPSSALNQIRRLLASGGILAVAVPNETVPIWGQRLRRLRRSPFGPFRPGDEIHLVHFLPHVFRRMLRNHGFDIIEFGVDDVQISRGWKDVLSYQSNVVLNALCHWHFDTAMYAICRKS